MHPAIGNSGCFFLKMLSKNCRDLRNRYPLTIQRLNSQEVKISQNQLCNLWRLTFLRHSLHPAPHHSDCWQAVRWFQISKLLKLKYDFAVWFVSYMTAEYTGSNWGGQNWYILCLFSPSLFKRGKPFYGCVYNLLIL